MKAQVIRMNLETHTEDILWELHDQEFDSVEAMELQACWLCQDLNGRHNKGYKYVVEITRN